MCLVVLYVCVCVSLDSVLCCFCTVLSRLCLVLSLGSTLSAQSVPTMYPGQLALLAPGGLADSCSNTLQPLKPCPSSNNPCSAYTSEGALSVPSLCAPTPGKHVMESSVPHHKSRASVQTPMRACGPHPPPSQSETHFFYLSPSVSLRVWTLWWLTVTLFLCIPSIVSLSSPLISALFLIYYFSAIYLSPHFFYPHLSLYCTLLISSTLLLPLFRLCKVQLGFGAFGLQAWQQEDALSEYALLGSLCVTPYFFALPFTCCPYLCCTFPLLLYMSSHGHPVLRVSYSDEGRPPTSFIVNDRISMPPNPAIVQS